MKISKNYFLSLSFVLTLIIGNNIFSVCPCQQTKKFVIPDVKKEKVKTTEIKLKKAKKVGIKTETIKPDVVENKTKTPDIKPATLEKKEECKCLIISLMGKPGAGKGTLSDRIKDSKMGFKILSVGDLCREEIAKKSEKGKQLEAFVKEGKLAPDEMIHEMVKAWLEEKMKDKKLIILDGYPRTKKQAELFLSLLKESNFAGCQFKVVNLEIPDEKIIERLENRFICSRCKRTYNYPCPACGGKLIRRTDDTREIVADRLKVYAENVKPLVDFYKESKTQFDDINSDGTPDTLIANFKKVLPCEPSK